MQAPQPKASGSGRHEKRRIAAAEVCLDRPPADVRAAIERCWADGLDPHAIVERLAGQGVTIHHVMVERYLYPGGGRI